MGIVIAFLFQRPYDKKYETSLYKALLSNKLYCVFANLGFTKLNNHLP
jgi:hypothetical protein